MGVFGGKKVADPVGVELQLKRIADSFEIYLTRVCGVDLNATTEDMSESDIERTDAMSSREQEWQAAIEELEELGISVPASSYKAIGLEPPNKEDEPTDDEVSRPQIGSRESMSMSIATPTDAPEPITARRDEKTTP